jgi:hypothetical protein
MSWEQVDNALTAAAHFVASKVGKTGLTVTAYAYRNGTLVASAVPATEVGNGFYTYTLASGYVTQPGLYLFLFKTTDSTVDQQEIPAAYLVGLAGVEYLDASIAGVPDGVLDEVVSEHLTSDTTGAKLSLIGTASVTVVSPLASDGETLTLVRGDDYLEAQNREITFSSTDWPDLTGATEVIMTIRRRPEGFSSGSSEQVLLVRKDVSGSRSVGGSPQSVTFELDTGTPDTGETGDTGDLLPGTGTGKYDVQATLSDASIATLVTGVVNVTEDQTR